MRDGSTPPAQLGGALIYSYIMQIVLPSMQRPRYVTGKVCNQAPDSYLEADKSLALDTGSGAVAKSSAEMEETLARSHDFCRCELGPEGCGSLQHLDH